MDARTEQRDGPSLFVGIELEVNEIVNCRNRVNDACAAMRVGMTDRYEAAVKQAADEIAQAAAQMSRALVTLNSTAERERVARWAAQAPTGTRVEFKQAKRTLDQNSLMWARLTDVAAQKEHAGRKYTPDQWKVIFLHAIGQEVQFIPSLDGATFIPWGQRSSDLSKDEMSQLIDFIGAWGAENGVTFHEPSAQAPNSSSGPASPAPQPDTKPAPEEVDAKPASDGAGRPQSSAGKNTTPAAEERQATEPAHPAPQSDSAGLPGGAA